jgi:hypothetical protein
MVADWAERNFCGQQGLLFTSDPSGKTLNSPLLPCQNGLPLEDAPDTKANCLAPDCSYWSQLLIGHTLGSVLLKAPRSSAAPDASAT